MPLVLKVCDNLSERVEEMYTLLLRMFDRHQEDEKHTEEEMATRPLIEKRSTSLMLNDRAMNIPEGGCVTTQLLERTK